MRVKLLNKYLNTMMLGITPAHAGKTSKKIR